MKKYLFNKCPRNSYVSYVEYRGTFPKKEKPLVLNNVSNSNAAD